MPSCPNCGSEISVSMIFCPECGYRFIAPEREQLLEKAKERLFEIATACEVNAVEVLNEIADSMETASKSSKKRPRWRKRDPWPLWWTTFLKEWSLKCCARWIGKCRDSKDYQRMQNLWLQSFEPLWVAGCDIARIDRFNILMQGHSSFVSRMSEPITKDAEEALLQWLIDWEANISKEIDLFREKQRQVMRKTLEDLRQYDEDSPLGRFLSE